MFQLHGNLSTCLPKMISYGLSAFFASLAFYSSIFCSSAFAAAQAAACAQAFANTAAFSASALASSSLLSGTIVKMFKSSPNALVLRRSSSGSSSIYPISALTSSALNASSIYLSRSISLIEARIIPSSLSKSSLSLFFLGANESSFSKIFGSYFCNQPQNTTWSRILGLLNGKTGS